MTAFLDITAAVRDALLASPALAGGNVNRGRNVPLAASAVQGIDVGIGSAQAQPLGMANPALQWESTVIVTCKARAAAGTDAEAAVDPLLAATWARLLAMPAPAGVVAMTLEPAVRWDVEEADQPLAAASLALRVTHLTTTNSLT